MSTFSQMRFKEKKDRIIYAAADLFAEKGYERTTLEEIAAGLKMTKGSVYYYFNGKEDILFQSLLKAHFIANDYLSKIFSRKDLSPAKRIEMAIKEHCKLITNKFVYATLRQQELLLPGEMRKEINTERAKIQRMYMDLIREGMKDGSFKKLNLRMVTFSILGAVNWVARWYSPNGSLNADEIGESFVEYLVPGLLKQQESINFETQENLCKSL